MPQTDRLHAILRASGADRPGLLLALARFVGEHDGNIIRDVEEVFGTRAELLLYIDLPASHYATMAAAAVPFGASVGLEVEVVQADAHGGEDQPVGNLLAISDDFPGLLARVAAFLAGHDFDILSHQGARQVVASEGGVRVRYVQYFTLRRSPTCDLLAFEDELRALKHAWGVFLRYREDAPHNPSIFADLQSLGDFPAGT